MYREDHSAETFNRPEFKKLLEFVRKTNSKIGYLFFTTWDRFSRNTTDAYEMLRKLNKLNIEVQAVEQYIDFGIPENKFLLAFYLSYTHIENERRGIKIFDGVKAAKEAGRWPGKAPFGYKNTRDQTNKPIIIPDGKAEIIQKVFSDFSKGMTQVEIRLECRKLGFCISKSQFSRILRNPAYIGKVLVRDKKNDAGYYINGIHKPFVASPLFEKIQLLLDVNKKKRNMPKVQTIKEELYLRSHLLCPNCGNNMTGSASKSKTGQKHHYYHCNYCYKVRFMADCAHERILSIITEINFSKNATELYSLMVKKIFQDKTPKRKNSEETISQEILIYQNRIVNLQDDYADRKISMEDYQTSIDRYRQKIQALQLETQEKQTTQPHNKEFLKSGINLLTNLKKFYVSTDLTSRMRLLGSIFPEKLIFEENKSRTPKINEAVQLLLATDKGFNEKGTTQFFKNLELFPLVELKCELSNQFIADLELLNSALSTSLFIVRMTFRY